MSVFQIEPFHFKPMIEIHFFQENGSLSISHEDLILHNFLLILSLISNNNI
jgi:hypothetical protein